jgi:hypothetical protein
VDGVQCQLPESCSGSAHPNAAVMAAREPYGQQTPSAALSISSRGSTQLELAASDAKAGWAGMSLLEGGADNSQEWALPGVFPQP